MSIRIFETKEIKSVTSTNHFVRSIEAMNIDIDHQIEQLRKLELPFMEENIDDCIFTGSGDSYLASLIGSYASNSRAKCCHPKDIVLNPKIVSNRKVFLVSISGATKATILAAKTAKKYALQTVSITARPESPLVKNSDQVIRLRYKSTNVVTSGTIGFTASMLSCLSLVIRVKINNLEKIYEESSTQADLITHNVVKEPSKHIFLGSGVAFPAAIYGSLKMNEVLGVASFAYDLDEYCHSPIFSVKSGDRIIILANNKDEVRVSKVIESHLRKRDVSTFQITSSNRNMVMNLLKFIFFLQLYPAKLALIKGVKDCYFLANTELLALSSNLIYS